MGCHYCDDRVRGRRDRKCCDWDKLLFGDRRRCHCRDRVLGTDDRRRCRRRRDDDVLGDFDNRRRRRKRKCGCDFFY
ncbi:hypothetical protein QTG56_10420 [Rossellomorea sp. AcN35-11]|nr:hypothetical protein [Rossellomorea aquimaris]WJV31301.1 hypothetical protein QTG56_10420 [Rossellomorea sp. AcN35-11]